MLVRPKIRFRATQDAVYAVTAYGHVAQGKLGACKGLKADHCEGVDLGKDSLSVELIR